MSCRLSRWLILPLLAGLLLTATPVLAQDAKPDEPKSAANKPDPDKPDTDKPDTDKPDTDKPEEADPFALPKDADVETLVAFINELRSYRPKSQQEYLSYLQKAPKAFLAASDRILELEKDKESAAFQLATMVKMQSRIQSIGRATADEKDQLIGDIKKYISSRKSIGRDEIGLAMGLAQTLERGRDEKLTARVYRELGQLVAKSDDEKIARYGAMMEGAARRLTLVGKEFELEGTQFDGTPFELKSLRGKVVLIDFWATWCGPCIAEYPNMMKNYEGYHDKGFEIVGVSIDQNRDALAKYLEEKQVPWLTLHDEKNGGQHPAVTHYGIFGIPAMYLVGKDGKVISTQARGRQLNQLLLKHLGEPSEAPADPAEK